MSATTATHTGDTAAPNIIEIDNGYRVQETPTTIVEVWRYMFNWRLVSYPAGQQVVTSRGYCFYGTGLESLTRAVAAGIAWETPLTTDPPDYDKRAFPDPTFRDPLVRCEADRDAKSHTDA